MTEKKMVESVLKNAAILDAVHETVKRLDAKLDGLDHIIRGNGSPGLVQKVSEVNMKLEVLEGGRNRWRDACFTVAGGIVVGVAVFLFSNSWSNHHADASVSQMQQK